MGGKLQGLQALRAIAAFLVAIQHAVYLSFTAAGVDSIGFNGLELGNMGVFIFFVISGVVMALATSDDNPTVFGLSRLLRIYPAYFLALAFATLILTVAGKPPQLTLDSSLLLIPSGELNGTFEIPYWTLIYEVQFYVLLWAAMLCGASHGGRLWLMFTWAIVIFVAGASGISVPVANPSLTQIPFGAINLFFIFGYVATSSMMLRKLAPILSLGLTTSFSSLYLKAWPEHYLAQVVLCLAIVLATVQIARVPRFLSKIGDWSYGLYLVHLPVIYLTLQYAHDWPLWVLVGGTLTAGIGVGLVFGSGEMWLYRTYLRPVARRSLGTAHPIPRRSVTN